MKFLVLLWLLNSLTISNTNTMNSSANSAGFADFEQHSKGSFSTYLTNIDDIFSTSAQPNDDFQKIKNEYRELFKTAINEITDTISGVSAEVIEWREGTHAKENAEIIDQKLLRLDEVIKEMNFKLLQIDKVVEKNWEQFKTDADTALANWQKETDYLIREIKELMLQDIEKS